jgi:hypothetical protein
VQILNETGVSELVVDEVKKLLALRKRSLDSEAVSGVITLLEDSGIATDVVDEIKSLLHLSKCVAWSSSLRVSAADSDM